MNKPAKFFYFYFKKKRWFSSNITSYILVDALPEVKTNELIYEIISYSLMGGEEGIRALALGLLGEPTPLGFTLLLERHPDIFRMTSFI